MRSRTVPQLVADHFVASGTSVSSITIYGKGSLLVVVLTCMWSMEELLTSVKDLEDILKWYYRPYYTAIGDEFILMDDNALSHQAVPIEDYLRILVSE
ncbi:hypothetical protein TNCV_529821 [Trichonephila clavipes]|nr:hypothetical protein TNCV_529821 [Trichonephila clavipes]